MTKPINPKTLLEMIMRAEAPPEIILEEVQPQEDRAPGFKLILKETGPDEVCDLPGFPTAYGGLVRAPKRELDALVAMQDKYHAFVMVIDGANGMFNYDEEDNVGEPKDRIEALAFWAKSVQNQRPKLDWLPAELAQFPHLHTLYVFGWDIETLSSTKYEIMPKDGQKTVFYDESSAFEKFKELTNNADLEINLNISFGPYNCAISRHSKIDAWDAPDVQCDAVFSGPHNNVSLQAGQEKVLEQVKQLFEKDGYHPTAGRMEFDANFDGNRLQCSQIYLPIKHLYFINNNTKDVGEIDGFVNLKNLVLSENKIAHGLWHIAELTRAGNLKQVDFSGNPLDYHDISWVHEPLLIIQDSGVCIKGLPDSYKLRIRSEKGTDLSAAKAVVGKVGEHERDPEYWLAKAQEMLDELGSGDTPAAK
jgi:hypothetical protein